MLPSSIHAGRPPKVFYAAVGRVIRCDDGVTRLELIPDEETVRLSEDPKRNQFAVVYISEQGLKAAGMRVEDRYEPKDDKADPSGDGE